MNGFDMAAGAGAPGLPVRPGHHPGFPLPAAIAGVIIAVAACAVPYGYLVPGAVLAAATIVWTFKRPAVAVALIIAGQILLLERSETITLAEFIYGAYFYGFLAWWFARRWFVDRVRVTDRRVDRLLIAYLVFAAVSIVPALVVGTDLLAWFREYLTVATLFLYFPLREVMNNLRHRRLLFGAGALLVVGIAADNAINYGMKAAVASYLWELLGARQAAHAHLLFPAFIALSAAAVHLEGPKRYAAALGWLATLAALVLTFARGFWLGAVVGVLVVYLLSPGTVRSRIVHASLVVGVTAIAGVVLYGGDFSGRLLQSLGERFVSSGRSMGDISLRARFIESEAILGRIAASPVLGNGIGAKFTYYDILNNVTSTTPYAHNGYLFLVFKVGLVGAALILAWFGSVLRIVWTSSRTAVEIGFSGAMVRAAAGIFVGLLLINVTSNVFIERASLLAMAFFGAMVVSNASPYPSSVQAE